MTTEDFLSRWSRRKRDSVQEEASHAPAPDAVAEAAGLPATNETEPKFDPASLPPIESITALSDIKAFLREGVPAELTRAALRHVWTADPSIRDFVGLAENAWDFTDPNAMPGFGPLEATEEVRRMIARVVGEIGQMAQPDGAMAVDAPTEWTASSGDTAITEPDKSELIEGPPDETGKINAAHDVGTEVLLHRRTDNTALQHDLSEEQEKTQPSLRRVHGGALPQ